MAWWGVDVGKVSVSVHTCIMNLCVYVCACMFVLVSVCVCVIVCVSEWVRETFDNGSCDN